MSLISCYLNAPSAVRPCRYRKTMVAALASKHLQTLRPAPTTEAGTATSTSSAAPTRTELSASPVQAAGGPSGRKMIR